jgi:drug/metabolite transporter (DMT)-like permease
VPVWLWVIGREPLVGDYDRVGVGYAAACLLMNMLGSVMLGSLLKSSDSPGGITVLTAMYPVVTGLLCWGLLGEEYTLRKVIAVVLMLCGVALFSY